MGLKSAYFIHLWNQPEGDHLLLLFLLYRPETRDWQAQRLLTGSPKHRCWDAPLPLSARLKKGLCGTELNMNRYPHPLVLPIILCLQYSRASLAYIFTLFHIPHTKQLQSPKNYMVRPNGSHQPRYSGMMLLISSLIALPKYQTQTT